MAGKSFNPHLEALRGLATLMVAGGHALVVYPVAFGAQRATDVALWFFNGDAAVTLFFVLSGVVLGMGIQRAGSGSVTDWRAYAVRRFFRIYPVFLLSTLAVLAFIFIGHALTTAPRWFNSGLQYRQVVLNLNTPPTLPVIGTNLLMLNASLNLVTWTLGVEMFCSLLLPLAHYARVRLPASGAMLLLLVSVAAVFIPKWLLIGGLVELEGALPWQYLGYFFLFYIGYLLPVIGPSLFQQLRSPLAHRAVFVLALVGLLSARQCGDTYRFLAGVSAWFLLGCVMYGEAGRVRAFLDSRVVRFYGSISYSFYLIHDLVLIVLARCAAHWLFGNTPNQPWAINVLLLVISVAVATGIARWLHRHVELPFIEVGRRCAARIRGRSVSPATEIPVPSTP